MQHQKDHVLSLSRRLPKLELRFDREIPVVLTIVTEAPRQVAFECDPPEQAVGFAPSPSCVHLSRPRKQDDLSLDASGFEHRDAAPRLEERQAGRDQRVDLAAFQHAEER